MNMEITFPGGARVDAAFKGFVVKTDQPPYGGGQGSAPTPFDLFLASIGTCAGIFVSGFCRQRNIPTDNIRIRQSLEVERNPHRVAQVNLDIDLPLDFPTKYTNALIKAASLCSVKKHVENPPKFNVQTHIK
jgi:ribosomal protein S12 methylthiotransferase accessory factor